MLQRLFATWGSAFIQIACSSIAWDLLTVQLISHDCTADCTIDCMADWLADWLCRSYGLPA